MRGTWHSLSRGSVSCALHCSLPAGPIHTQISPAADSSKTANPSATTMVAATLLLHAGGPKAKQKGVSCRDVSRVSTGAVNCYTHVIGWRLTSSPKIAACRDSKAACTLFKLRCSLLAATSCTGMSSAIGDTMSASLSSPPSKDQSSRRLHRLQARPVLGFQHPSKVAIAIKV